MQAPRPYLGMFRAGLLQASASPRGLWLQVFASATWVFLAYSFWEVAGLQESPLPGMSVQRYFLLAFLVNGFSVSAVEMQTALRVRTGDVITDLLRPASFSLRQVAYSAGQASVSGALAALVVAGAALVSGTSLVPRVAWVLGAFGVALVLSVLVRCALAQVTSLACFYVGNGQGVFIARTALANLLSGVLIPLAWMPSWLSTASQWSPFAALVHLPLRLASGLVEPPQAVELLGRQVLWCAVLGGLSVLLEGRVRRGHVFQGG
jgi:ABC-2 type transport system permease protein